MPFLKKPKIREPVWKENDYNAQKKGIRHTITNVNGDQYTGEWLDNKKDGKGTYKWQSSGALYDGDWKGDKQNGFGTYSVAQKKGAFKKEYSGGWKNTMRHGYGTQYYLANEYYEGEWYANNRSGWGRMYYRDGKIYEGEWYDDMRNGQGMLRMGDCLCVIFLKNLGYDSMLVNEDRYEGSWKDDKKNGIGKYFFLNTGQLHEGIWVNDIAKCGIMKDCERDKAPMATLYPIAELQLKDFKSVINEAEEQFLQDED